MLVASWHNSYDAGLAITLAVTALMCYINVLYLLTGVGILSIGISSWD